MVHKIARLAGAFLLITLLFSGCNKAEKAESDLEILFLPAWGGEVFGCDCRVPNPGLSRAVYAVKERMGQSSKDETMLVGTGNFLPPFKSEKLTALLTESYSSFEITALGMGYGELINYYSTEESSPGHDLPVIGSNFAIDRTTEDVHFYQLVEKGPHKIGIVSLIDPNVNEYGSSPEDGFIKTAQDIIANLKRDGATLIILLSALTPEQEIELTKTCRFDLVISANNRAYREGKLIGETFFVSALNVPGSIEVFKEKSAYTFTFSPLPVTYRDTPEDETVKKNVQAYLDNQM